MSAQALSPVTYPHINLLRAFAALSVLVYHVIMLDGWSDFPSDYGLWWFSVGWMSVDLFFVISGFVITHALLQLARTGLRHRTVIQQFMHRRLLRIAPLYLLTGACFLLTHDSLSWKAIAAYLTFTQNISHRLFGSLNGITWSVALEMQFYLLMVLTLPWWRKRHWLTVLLTAIGIALLGRAGIWQLAEAHDWDAFKRFVNAVRLPMVLDEFAFGIVLALMPRLSSRLTLPLLAATIALVSYPVFQIYFANGEYWHIGGMVIFWRTGLGLLLALIVAFATYLPPNPNPGPLYRAGFYLGEISYGIYLWHLTIIDTLRACFTLSHGELLLAVLAIVLPLSALTWHLIEKPCILYGKRKTKATLPSQ